MRGEAPEPQRASPAALRCQEQSRNSWNTSGHQKTSGWARRSRGYQHLLGALGARAESSLEETPLGLYKTALIALPTILRQLAPFFGNLAGTRSQPRSMALSATALRTPSLARSRSISAFKHRPARTAPLVVRAQAGECSGSALQRRREQPSMLSPWGRGWSSLGQMDQVRPWQQGCRCACWRSHPLPAAPPLLAGTGGRRNVPEASAR